MPRPVGKHLFVDGSSTALCTKLRVAAKLCGKLCRQTLPCGNLFLMVSAYAGRLHACRRIPTGRARICSAMRCSPRASMRGICSRIMLPARRMTVRPGAGARIRSPRRRVGRVEARPARPFTVASARPGDLTQGQAGGVPLTDGEPWTPPRHRASFCSRCSARSLSTSAP